MHSQIRVMVRLCMLTVLKEGQVAVTAIWHAPLSPSGELAKVSFSNLGHPATVPLTAPSSGPCGYMSGPILYITVIHRLQWINHSKKKPSFALIWEKKLILSVWAVTFFLETGTESIAQQETWLYCIFQKKEWFLQEPPRNLMLCVHYANHSILHLMHMIYVSSCCSPALWFPWCNQISD